MHSVVVVAGRGRDLQGERIGFLFLAEFYPRRPRLAICRHSGLLTSLPALQTSLSSILKLLNSTQNFLLPLTNSDMYGKSLNINTYITYIL